MWLKELTCSICGRQMDIPGGEVHGKHICKTCFQLFRHDEKNGDGKNVTIDWLRQDMTTEEMIGQIERELKEAAALQAMSGLNNIEKVMELSDKQRPAALASAALLKLVRALVVQNQLLLSNGIKREKLASRTQRLAEYLGSQHGRSRQ
ncbi:MAG: hypothetical protein OEW84_02535 [Aigarchaeota archaeon]|nr:hypothetical protein [Aigarchaeota archaeon]